MQIKEKSLKSELKQKQQKALEEQFKEEELKLKDELDNEKIDTNNPYMVLEQQERKQRQLEQKQKQIDEKVKKGQEDQAQDTSNEDVFDSEKCVEQVLIKTIRSPLIEETLKFMQKHHIASKEEDPVKMAEKQVYKCELDLS